jgi:hypothetical protein
MKIHSGYQIKPHKEVPTCYIIVVDGKGGKIPKTLEGLYTSPTLAMQHIDKYVDSKDKKE